MKLLPGKVLGTVTLVLNPGTTVGVQVGGNDQPAL
jgi:hypothetical protein